MQTVPVQYRELFCYFIKPELESTTAHVHCTQPEMYKIIYKAGSQIDMDNLCMLLLLIW